MTADRTARLVAIQGRHAKATPGEWFFDGEPHNIIIWSDGENRVCFMTSNGPAEENAAFIVNARTDIPFVLTDNARLEAELAASEARVREARKVGIGEAIKLLFDKETQFLRESAEWLADNMPRTAGHAKERAGSCSFAMEILRTLLAQEGDGKDEPPLSEAEKREQAAKCSCRGTDDMCPCQNVRRKS